MMREALQERSASGDEEEASAKAKQRAIKLLNLGLTSNDDMRLLTAYFGRLENSTSATLCFCPQSACANAACCAQW